MEGWEAPGQRPAGSGTTAGDWWEQRKEGGKNTSKCVCQGLSASFHTAADPSGTGFNTIFLLIENELSLVADDLITLQRMRF